MLSQEKLLQVIDEDLRVCDCTIPTDEPTRQQKLLEHATLTNHLWLARGAGDDQNELEKVVRSLEKNPVTRGYQHWRERVTIK